MNPCPCCGQDSTYFDPAMKCLFCQDLPPSEEWPYFPCDPQFTGHEGPPGKTAARIDIIKWFNTHDEKDWPK